MNNKKSLTEGPVGKKLISLTIPMIFGIFAIMAFNLIDTYFVAQLGTKELAAMSFTFPVVFFVANIAMGLGIATSSVVSRSFGEKDMQKTRRLTTDSLTLSLVIVIVFVIIGFLTIDSTFKLLGATDEILPLIKDYMRIWYVGMIFLVIPMVGNNAIRGSGDTKTPAIIMTLSAIINTLIDPLLIFGIGIFPRLELKGAAIATVIGRATSMALSIAILHFRKKMIDFSIPKIKSVIDSWEKILYIGIPSALTNVMVPIAMGLITKLLSQFGPAVVAAIGAGIRIEAFSLLVIMALATALIPFIGQNWGARKFDRIKKAQSYSNKFSILWGALSLIIFLLSARPISHIFTNDPLVIIHLTHYLWIVPIAYGLRGIFRLTAASLNAINKPMIAASLNAIWLFALLIPFSYLGCYLAGVNGVFFAIVLSNIVIGLISLIYSKHMLPKNTPQLKSFGL